MPAQRQVHRLGLVEAHHDVARVQVRVHEVVDQQHVQERVKPFVRDLLLEHPAAVLEERSERDPRGELLDQDLSRGVLGVGEGEPGGGAVAEVLAEHGQVGGFDPEVQLEPHHLAELADLAREVEPFHGGDRVDQGGEAGHDPQIAADQPFDFRMQDFDGHVGGGDPLRGGFDDPVDVLADAFAEFGGLGVGDVGVARGGEVGSEFRFVDLGYGADAQWFFLELFKDIGKGPAVECFFDAFLGVSEGMSGGVRVEG